MFSSVIIACENNSLSAVCLLTFAVQYSLTMLTGTLLRLVLRLVEGFSEKYSVDIDLKLRKVLCPTLSPALDSSNHYLWLV